MAGAWKTARTGPLDGPLWRHDLVKTTPLSSESDGKAKAAANNATTSAPIKSAAWPLNRKASIASLASGRAAKSSATQLPKDITLFQFLDVDGRPTIILKLLEEGSSRRCHDRHIYENTAFHKAYKDGRAKNAFVAHAVRHISDSCSSTASFSVTILGRPCTATVIQKQWILLSWDSMPAPQEKMSASLPLRKTTSSGGDVTTTTCESTADMKQHRVQLLGWLRFGDMQLSAHQHLIADYPWHTTALGPIESWSDVLKLTVTASVLNPEPRALYWGDDFTAIYNERCVPIFGSKHPQTMGQGAQAAWPETWPIVGPYLLKALHEGAPSKLSEQQCFFRRNEMLEEVFFDSTYLPIPGLESSSSGVLQQFSEITDRVVASRHQSLVDAVNEMAWNIGDESKYWASVSDRLQKYHADVPYALIYLPSRHGHDHCGLGDAAPNILYSLTHAIGLASKPTGKQQCYEPRASESREDALIASIREAHAKDRLITLSATDGTLPDCLRRATADRGHGDDVANAFVLSIANPSGGLPLAFVVLGMNPRRPLDQRTRTFAEVLQDSLMKGAAMTSMPRQKRMQIKKLEDLHQSLLQRLHHSDRELERLKNRYERMSSSAPVGMFMYTPDGLTPIYVNDEFLSIFGLTKEEYYRDGWQNMVHDDDLDRVVAEQQSMLKTFKPMTIEYRVKKDFQVMDEMTGLPIWAPQYVIATCMPEFDEDGTCINFQGWVLNVSEARLNQKLLSSRLEEVTASKQNAENFIDLISHEIRNPLSAILQSADGIAAMVQNSSFGDVRASIEDASQTIILCAQHQKRIVDDILTLSKLDANLLVISPDKTNPRALLREVLKMLEAQIEQASIRTTIEISPSMDVLHVDEVMMDSSRVLQVVINLLTNAIKFTQHAKPKREIALVVSASKTQPDNVEDGLSDVHFIPRRESRPPHQAGWEWGMGQDLYITFMVRDTGKGLTEEEMKTLFQRFHQASPRTYKTYGGSGLGLYISRDLVELQGGQIGVSSVAGVGSTFAFYVHTKRWMPVTPLGGPSHRLQNPALLESPVLYSKRQSAVMQLDIGAGTLNGASSPKSSPVVHPAAARKTTLETESSPSAVCGSASSAVQPVSLTILIVEDNEVNAKVMSKQLRNAGQNVHVVHNGLEALEFLPKTTLWASAGAREPLKPCQQAQPQTQLEAQTDYFCLAAPAPRVEQQQHVPPSPPASDQSSCSYSDHTISIPLHPHQHMQQAERSGGSQGGIIKLDVILMDLEMPVLDGLSAVRRIRAMEAQGQLGARVPVLAVTANARSEQIVAALAAGMDNVVTKPFRIPQVLQRARQLIVGRAGRGKLDGD